MKQDALRAQANRHGWTKRDYADSLIDPTLARIAHIARTGGSSAPMPAALPAPSASPADAEPVDALVASGAEPADAAALAHAAVAGAAKALAQGRTAEAAARLKIAESLAKLASTLPPPPDPCTPEDRARQELEEEEAYVEHVWRVAERIAEGLLTDRSNVPAVLARISTAWRKEHLGEEAAADRERSERDGSAHWIYGPDGEVLPHQSVEAFKAAHGMR